MVQIGRTLPASFAFLLVLAWAWVGLTSCGKKYDVAGEVVLQVAAAADLKFAMDSLIESFMKDHPQIQVRATYGSSGNFYAQVINGAPFDMYFSADVRYPGELRSKGYALEDDVFTYAIGRLVVWVPRSSTLDPVRDGIESLLDPAVRKIAIANPAHAPYGLSAVSAMKSLGVYDQVKAKFVLGENIAQTAQFIESGSADIGLIALSLALAPQMEGAGRYWEVPTTSFPVMFQGGMILKSTPHRDAAKAFRDYVLGAEGRQKLKEFGFYLPDPKL